MNPLTNTPPSSADAVLAEAAAGPVDPLDALLRQIVAGYFVLTDGQGSVSKWSEPAELLFDQPAEAILGQSFFETLIGGALPPAGQAWREFLDFGETPRVPGTVELTGRRSDGADFPMETVFIPVKLDEGFDFSLFLEDLSFELPMNLMLLRMRQQHPVVVRALRQALETEVAPWEGRTAGTFIVFRPLSSTPWVEAEMARREAERAAADAETEERLSNTDPGIQGGVADLDDAAAVVARLLSAMERIDELERVAGGLPAQLVEARREAERRAAESDRAADSLRAELSRALAGVPSELDRVEQLARLERLERAKLDGEELEATRRQSLAAAEAASSRLAARLDQLERDRAAAESAADGRLAEAIAAAESRAADAVAESAGRFEARLAGLEGVDLSSQLEQVRAEHEEAAQAARAELASTLERLERDREREREAARSELAAALERVEQVQRGTDAVREQLSAVTVERAASQGLAGDDRRRLEDLQRDAEALRARVEAMRERDTEQEQRHNALSTELAALREATSRHDGVADELASLRETTAADVALLREAVESGAGKVASGELDALRDAVADVAALREAVARSEGASDELAALREAVSRSEGASDEIAALREAVSRSEAASDGLRDAISRSESASDDIAALRQTIAELRASATGDTERHEAAASQLAELRDAVARQEAAAGQIASLTAVVARHEGLAGEIAQLRSEASAVPGEVAELRRLLAEQQAVAAELRERLTEQDVAAGRMSEQEAVERKVESLVGDTREQIAALHARIAGLAEASGDRGELDALRERLESLAGHDELAALHARFDAFPAHDELAGRDELAELRHRLDTLTPQHDLDALRDRLDGLAGRDELAGLASDVELDELRERLSGFVGHDALDERLSGLVGHDALDERLSGFVGHDALNERLSGFVGHDALNERLSGLVGHDELNGRLDGVAGREELSALWERLDGLAAASPEDGGVARQALAAAQDALQRIAQVDRGAGTVLNDVRALRALVDEALSLAQGAQESGRADSEELRDLIARFGGELEVASGQAGRAENEALSARQVAAAAGEAATAAREDAAKAREESTAGRREVTDLSERTALLGEQVESAREAVAGARAEARAVGEGLVERLAAVDQRASALKTELGVGRERLDAVGAHVDRLGIGVRETGEAVDTVRRDVEERATTLRSELGEVRHVAETAARGLEILLGELAGAREVAEAARSVSLQSDERILAMQSELTFALKSVEELKQGLSSAGQAAVIARREAEQARKAAQHVGDGSTERVTEVFQQILGLAAARNHQQPARRPAVSPAPVRAEPVKREPRHGFDDAAAPMAVLSLDGKFKQLNPAFTKLVGYKEHEFTKAAWPSPHDRRDYKEQLEQLRQMGLGELRAVDVQSTYMHGQGLMVPVVGKLTLELGEDGLPLQLLLEAEDRYTN